jgi:ssDNA-binding Zn-finger/Zn-ribbon topoisomerase 1
MVDYVARQGKFAGKHFWACNLYPKCTGIALAVESEEQSPGSHAAA